MESIKSRRLSSRLSSHPDLLVGGCVPFYLCPRSIMLYLIYRRNPNLAFQGGQDQVVTLELDLYKTAQWAQQSGLRWAFTLSNAGSYYFEDRSNLAELSQINWDAVQTNRWSGAGIDTSIKDGKQAEFLVEKQVDWGLIERIGVSSHNMVGPVSNVMLQAAYRPKIEVRTDWYY